MPGDLVESQSDHLGRLNRETHLSISSDTKSGATVLIELSAPADPPASPRYSEVYA